jgi:hypothetical protein
MSTIFNKYILDIYAEVLSVCFAECIRMSMLDISDQLLFIVSGHVTECGDMAMGCNVGTIHTCNILLKNTLGLVYEIKSLL